MSTAINTLLSRKSTGTHGSFIIIFLTYEMYYTAQNQSHTCYDSNHCYYLKRSVRLCLCLPNRDLQVSHHAKGTINLPARNACRKLDNLLSPHTTTFSFQMRASKESSRIKYITKIADEKLSEMFVLVKVQRSYFRITNKVFCVKQTSFMVRSYGTVTKSMLQKLYVLFVLTGLWDAYYR